jgi:DNA sulfur modification protein DndD
MLIEKVELHNFGVFRGRHEIDLSPNGSKKPVILFGGLNGSGKTTFLESLNLGLYGKTAPRIRGGNGNYDKYLRRLINSGVPAEEGASVGIRFRSNEDGNNKELFIRRSWAGHGEKVQEHFDVFVNGDLDETISENWSQVVERYIPARLSHLFFFDGERVENLADPEKSKEMMFTAIHSLLGIDLVEKLKSDLSYIDRQKKKSLKDEGTQEIIQKLELEVESINKTIGSHKQKMASAQNHIDRASSILKGVDEEFVSMGGALSETQKELDKEKKEIETIEQVFVHKLVEFASGASPLLFVRHLIEPIYKQDQMEQEAERANSVLSAVQNRDKKILSLLKKHKAKDVVLNEVEEVIRNENNMWEDKIGSERYLNMGTGTRNSLGILNDELLDAIQRDGKKLIDEYSEIKIQKENVDEKLAAVPDEESVRLISEKRKKTYMEKEKLVGEMLSHENELERLEREKGRIVEKLETQLRLEKEVDLENQDVSRFLVHSNRVQNTMEKFRKRLLEQHVSALENLIFEGYSQLLRKKRMLGELKIDPETCELHFKDLKGAPILPERLSAGERQLLAVSILWGLARASGRPMPVVVDTPLGRLDSTHREYLVERYFPYASHQVFLLSTDEEIDQRYFKTIKKWVGRSYQFKYDDKTGSSHIRPGYFW